MGIFPFFSAAFLLVSNGIALAMLHSSHDDCALQARLVYGFAALSYLMLNIFQTYKVEIITSTIDNRIKFALFRPHFIILLVRTVDLALNIYFTSGIKTNDVCQIVYSPINFAVERGLSTASNFCVYYSVYRVSEYHKRQVTRQTTGMIVRQARQMLVLLLLALLIDTGVLVPYLQSPTAERMTLISPMAHLVPLLVLYVDSTLNLRRKAFLEPGQEQLSLSVRFSESNIEEQMHSIGISEHSKLSKYEEPDFGTMDALQEVR
ncbi:hypothetical protein EDD86DRAFT_217697 [Gorgonomyces haynaldii]|nr:hypothetical protein EDD86DRAFT_217697 [Gorgonomyces haynaldii]